MAGVYLDVAASTPPCEGWKHARIHPANPDEASNAARRLTNIGVQRRTGKQKARVAALDFRRSIMRRLLVLGIIVCAAVFAMVAANVAQENPQRGAAPPAG